jgi:hypothetical protein
MKIQQAYVSPDIQFFKPHFLSRYALSDYHDPYTPAFFYGCYNRTDLAVLAHHQSLAVIIWGGTDVTLPGMLAAVAQLPRTLVNPIVMLAGSSYIAEDLTRAQMPFLRRNIVPINPEDFQPLPLGDKVYVYAGSKQREHVYGVPLLPAIQEQLPDVDFLIHTSVPQTVPHDQMPSVYAQCFIGLRLVAHDACSCTVSELGLMGRRCVWNGDLPNALPWQTVDDVVAAIRQERQRIGQTDTLLAHQVQAALAPTDWLDTQLYDYQHRLLAFT